MLLNENLYSMVVEDGVRFGAVDTGMEEVGGAGGDEKLDLGLK